MMNNRIKETWRPEYDDDAYLRGLRGQLSGVLRTYEEHTDRYTASEDFSSEEREEEDWLADKAAEYNNKIASLETAYRNYVLKTYGHRPW